MCNLSKYDVKQFSRITQIDDYNEFRLKEMCSLKTMFISDEQHKPCYIRYKKGKHFNDLYLTPSCYELTDIDITDNVVTKLTFQEYRLSRLFQVMVLDPYLLNVNNLVERRNICRQLTYGPVHIKDCFSYLYSDTVVIQTNEELQQSNLYEITGTTGYRIHAEGARPYYPIIDWAMLLNIWEWMKQ